MKDSPVSRDCLGILVSCSIGLAYEITLTRMLSIATWYHFAFMVISIAMLGFGASGSFFFFIQEKSSGTIKYLPEFASCLMALSMPASLFFISKINLDFFQLSTRTGAWLACLWLYVILALPFFCLGIIVTCLLTRHAARATLIYGFDLSGAGLGCLLSLPLIQMLGIPGILLKLLMWCSPYLILRASDLDSCSLKSP
jgi:hypothetical protein